MPNLARLGFPIAEVAADGSAVITKVPGSGGMVTAATCKEQLFYEIHDPARYLTPDVIADFTQVRIDDLGMDRVAVRGGAGSPRPETLKVLLGYRAGLVGEGQISYAGPGAVARGQLALDIVRERLALVGIEAGELRYDLIGHSSIGAASAVQNHEPRELRARVAARTRTLRDAELGAVTRHCLPTFGAPEFLLGDSLGSGVTCSLALDTHGKCLSSMLLEMEIDHGVQSPDIR